MIGPRPNLLGLAAGTHKRLETSQPVLTNGDLDKIRSISELLDRRLPHRRPSTSPAMQVRAQLACRPRSNASASKRQQYVTVFWMLLVQLLL